MDLSREDEGEGGLVRNASHNLQRSAKLPKHTVVSMHEIQVVDPGGTAEGWCAHAYPNVWGKAREEIFVPNGNQQCAVFGKKQFCHSTAE